MVDSRQNNNPGKPQQTKLQYQLEQAKKDYQQQEYQLLVDAVKPKTAIVKNALAAFLVGGLICLIAQLILNSFVIAGMAAKAAGSAAVVVMVFLGALLTGLGIYDNIGRFAGAGSIVPITGFANSIVSPALEFKREGYIFGVGSRMFTIAGPVLVYGFLASVIIGLFAFLFR
ncbi:MAG: stage V sporulation protein AC [Bacillota bacterium]